jgi:Ni/Co efflux regulator RcnB
VDQLALRYAPGIRFRLDATQQSKPLDPQQHGADQSGQNHDRQGRENADPPANRDKSRDFKQRNDQKYRKKGWKSHTNHFACPRMGLL